MARCLEVEVTSQGDGLDEALTNLRGALELYFEDQPLPERVDPPIIALRADTEERDHIATT